MARHNALASAAALASDKVSVGEDNNDGIGGGSGFVSSPAKTTRNIKVKGISHRAMRNVVKFLNKGTIGFDEDEEGVDEFVEAAVALKLRGVSRKEQVRTDMLVNGTEQICRIGEKKSSGLIYYYSERH